VTASALHLVHDLNGHSSAREKCFIISYNVPIVQKLYTYLKFKLQINGYLPNAIVHFEVIKYKRIEMFFTSDLVSYCSVA